MPFPHNLTGYGPRHLLNNDLRLCVKLLKSEVTMDINKSRNIRQFNGERFSILKFRLIAILAEDVIEVLGEELPWNQTENTYC